MFGGSGGYGVVHGDGCVVHEECALIADVYDDF